MEPETEYVTFLDSVTHYFNVLIMTNKGRAVLGAILVAVGVPYFVHWKNESDRKLLTPKLQDVLKPVIVKDHNEKYRKLLEEREREERREEEIRNVKHERIMAEKRARHEKIMMELRATEREDELNSQRKKLESDERLAKLIEQNRMDQLVENKIASMENDQFGSQKKLELEEVGRKVELSREIHRRNVEKIDDNFERNQKQYEKEESQRREELMEQERKIEKRRREIEEQLERDLEELRKRDQQRRHEMNEQLRQIQKVLQMRVWNEIIESNWTKRLNMLRYSYQVVEKSYSQMKRIWNHDKNHLESHNKSLLTALSNEKDLMENERNEMDRLYSEYRKSFLLDIKDSVEDVSAECDRLSYALKYEPSNTERIEECFSALSRASMSIPTLAELKQRYKDSMSN